MAQESVLRIVIDSRNAERNAQSISRELQNIERTGDFATRSTDRLSVATRQLAGYMAGLATVGTAISKMDTYTGLNNRLKLVTASQNELNQALKDTFNIAQATGQSWDSTAQVYQRFADNAKRLGITLQETSALTETVAKAISISGGSAASAEAALVQFGQALASGVLRGEEFNSIAEQAPGLLKAIATGLNVNIGELRAMANEGKLTADVVVKSLEKAKVSVDDLFNKTDFTIGNSFTMLNNALIQFVGEAGKGSGAAQLISSSLMELAKNLETVTNVAMVGAAYWVGTYIPALGASVAAGYAKTKQLIEQTAIQYAAINAERAAAAQELASAQATVVNTQATLAALAAEKALEVERLKAQINQAGRIAATTRMAQLRRIETQVTAELTAAESALAAARARVAATSTASTAASAGLLGILGGPVGLGLTVASVAATYLLMSDNASKANKKLEEQAAVAEKTAIELSKLQGVERKSAINDLTAAFEAQNKEVRKSELAVGSALIKIQNYAIGNAEVARISNAARLGTISYTDAVKQLNRMEISPDLYNALKKQVEKYDESYIKANKTAVALKGFEVTVKMTGNAAQNAAIQQQKQADALNNTAAAADSAKKALSKLAVEKTDAQYILMTAKNLGGDIEKAKGLLAFRKDLGMGSTGGPLDPKKRAAFEASWAAQQQLKAYEESQKDLAKASSKAEKNRESANKKAIADADNLREKQKEMRDSIDYEYSIRSVQQQLDLEKQIADIKKAGFSPADQSMYINFAQTRFNAEKDLYQAKLAFELNEHKLTDEGILNSKLGILKRELKARTDIDDGEKKAIYKSELEKHDQAIRLLNIESNQRLNDAESALQTDLQNMIFKYETERALIKENNKLSDPEKARYVAASEKVQNKEFFSSRDSAWDSYQNAIGVDTSLEQASSQRSEAIQAAYEWELITQEEYQQKMLESQQQYEAAKLQTTLSSGADILGSLTSIAKNVAGENSSLYKAMFAMEKGMAVARSVMAIQSALALASNNPFPKNLIAMATVAAQTANIVGTIKGVQMPQGMAHSGIDRIPKEGTWLLDKGERVLSPRQNQDLTTFLDVQRESHQLNAINSQGSDKALVQPQVIVNVEVLNQAKGATVETQQIDENRVRIIVRDEVNRFVPNQIADSNSKISKSMQRHTTAKRERV